MQGKNECKGNARRKSLLRLVNAGLFLAIGMLLPFLTGQIKEIGDSLLPMHLAVMLCGVFCGWKYGLLVGAMLPFLRSAFFGMPPIYPNAVWMSLELATYGFVIGFLYGKVFRERFRFVFVALPVAQLAGRVVWGIAKAILLGAGGKSFTVAAFITGGFVDAIPGILLQWILIPLIIGIREKMQRSRS